MCTQSRLIKLQKLNYIIVNTDEFSASFNSYQKRAWSRSNDPFTVDFKRIEVSGTAHVCMGSLESTA